MVLLGCQALAVVNSRDGAKAKGHLSQAVISMPKELLGWVDSPAVVRDSFA